jgi:hypothetical protein
MIGVAVLMKDEGIDIRAPHPAAEHCVQRAVVNSWLW